MNQYQENELIGRTKFKSFITQLKGNPKVEFTEYEFDNKDAWVYIKDKTYAVEIKNRSPYYEGYNTYIMEKTKYDELENLYKKNVTVDGMMAYFFDDTLYLFNLKKIDELLKEGKIELIYKRLPNSTVNHQYDLDKSCYLLPKEYAYIYRKDKNNKWKRIQ